MDPIYWKLIRSLLKDDDISKIVVIMPLSNHFSTETKLEILRNPGLFFEKFKLVKDDKKYEDFIVVTKDISDWIPKLMANTDEAKEDRQKFDVIFELLHIQSEEAVKSFPMSEAFINECCSKGLITDITKGHILATKGDAAAKYQLLLEIPLKSANCYGTLLCILHRNMTNYIQKFCDDLYKSIEHCSEREATDFIMGYAASIIDKNRNVGWKLENDNIESDCVTVGLGITNNEEPSNIEWDGTPVNVCHGNLAKDEDDCDDCESSDSEDDNVEKEDNMDFFFGALKDRKSDDILNFSPPSEQRSDGDTSVLKVRGYQQELAQRGIEGNNVLICAPTGSGKTIVAVKIVEEHLQKNTNGKVAFVVHRIALVEQQYVQFSRYLKCRITRLSGSVKSSSTPLIGHIPSFDVFVMTSDILRNALEQDNETKLTTLAVFTMILFDECHNCDKKHPYNKIMHHYFKNQRDTKPVPQIIGLTASTGTNKANTMAKAMKRLYTLCANLDCFIVSTVKDFAEELRENQSVPNEEIILAEPRDKDNFEGEMQSQMKLCETMLQNMNARDFFPKDSETQLIFSIPEDRMHQKYANFVGKLDQRLLNKTKNEMEGREAIYAISQYLNAFARALMVNHLFRAQDAINLINDFLHLDTASVPTCKVESHLRKNLLKLENGKRMQLDNPCLSKLQEKIVEQLKADKESRIIVFVRERAYTQILKDVFTSLNNPAIRCDTIVGNTISSDKGGLTQNEMEEVLGRFRRGQCNVLFSTTVAEEGLDVQTCNLVIRYGHVTNETAMVQSRGRARAKDSKYLVIVPNKLQWQINKENINKYRESMMYKAIERFQVMDKVERDQQIEECKCERQLLEITSKTKIMSLLDQEQAKKRRLLNCKKCSTAICQSGDIRLAENAHHIVINTSVFDKLVVDMKNSKISCKKCANNLGNRQSYKGRLFPNLTISAFSVSCEGEPLSRSFKKWKDVDFTVNNVSNKELLDFQAWHALFQ